MKKVILFSLFAACHVAPKQPEAKQPRAIFLDSLQGHALRGTINENGDTVYTSFKRAHQEDERIFGSKFVKISWADSLKGLNMIVTTGDSIYYYDSLHAYPRQDHVTEFLENPDTATLEHDGDYYATSWGQKRVISKRYWIYPDNRNIISLRYWYTRIPATFDILTTLDSIAYYDRKLGWTNLYLDRAVNFNEKGKTKIRYSFLNEDNDVLAFKIIITTKDSLNFYDNKVGYKPVLIN